jgi:hypothetical protein
MKKYLIIIGILGSLVPLLISGTTDTNSMAAPMGVTGAPGELTCAKARCHTGADLNSGAGKMDISFGDANANYEPGKTYSKTITLQQQNIRRFGFEVVALDKNQQSMGTITFKDQNRMQLMPGENQFTGRTYLTYRYPGTDPFSVNTGQWSFTWKAPDKNEGPITFYAATVAANDDGTDKGDEVYSKSLTINTIK